MNIHDMIKTLQAAERGEQIEILVSPSTQTWAKWKGNVLHMDMNYRIAPKKELSLVEYLRTCRSASEDTCKRAADRIEELESYPTTQECLTTDELLDELKRRITE